MRRRHNGKKIRVRGVQGAGGEHGETGVVRNRAIMVSLSEKVGCGRDQPEEDAKGWRTQDAP